MSLKNYKLNPISCHKREVFEDECFCHKNGVGLISHGLEPLGIIEMLVRNCLFVVSAVHFAPYLTGHSSMMLV